MSPYNQNVIDATLAQINNQNAQQQQGVIGNSISAGAFGGDRTGVAQAALAGQQDLAKNSTIAGLYNQNYTQALGAAQNQASREGQAAFTMGQLGQEAQSTALTGASAQLQAGGLQQGTQQAKDTAAYQQFLNEQAYPFQTTSWLANISEGIGTNSGGTTTGTQTPPSIVPGVVGAGLSAASLFLSDERAKEDIVPVGKTFDHQTIYKFKYKGHPGTHIGLIAQDVEKKHPEAVETLQGGLKGVDYDEATRRSERPKRFADGGLASASYDQNMGMSDSPYGGVSGYAPSIKPLQMGHTMPAAPAFQDLSKTGWNDPDLQKGMQTFANSSAGKTLGSDIKNYFASPPTQDQQIASGFYADGGLVGRRGYADAGAVDDVEPGIIGTGDPEMSVDGTLSRMPEVPIVQQSSDLSAHAKERIAELDRRQPNALAPDGSPMTPSYGLDHAVQGYVDNHGIYHPVAGVSQADAASYARAPASAGVVSARAAPTNDNIAAPTGLPAYPMPRVVSHTPSGVAITDATYPATSESSAQVPEGEKNFLGLPKLSDPMRMALLSAGLGMMSSTSPYASVGIGQGGIQGVNSYLAAQKLANEQLTAQSGAQNIQSEIGARNLTQAREAWSTKMMMDLAQKAAKEFNAPAPSPVTSTSAPAIQAAPAPVPVSTAPGSTPAESPGAAPAAGHAATAALPNLPENPAQLPAAVAQQHAALANFSNPAVLAAQAAQYQKMAQLYTQFLPANPGVAKLIESYNGLAQTAQGRLQSLMEHGKGVDANNNVVNLPGAIQADVEKESALKSVDTRQKLAGEGLTPEAAGNPTEMGKQKGQIESAVTGAREGTASQYKLKEVQPVPGEPTRYESEADILAGNKSAKSNANPGVGSAPGSGLTIAKQPPTFAKQQDAIAADDTKMVQQYQQRQIVRERLGELSDLVEHYQSGALADVKAEAAAIGKAIGVPAPASWDPASFQKFIKNSTANIFDTVKSIGGRVLVAEITGLQKANAGPEMQPEANAAILGQTTGLMNYEDKFSNDYFKWRKENPYALNPDIAQFQTQWMHDNPATSFTKSALKNVAPKGFEPPPQERQDGQSYMTTEGKRYWHAQGGYGAVVPKVGTVYKGHKYIGGDPSTPNAWGSVE